MSDERTLELVSAAADGELDTRLQAEVEQLLRGSAEARRFRDDLARLETLLSGLPEPAFPDTLHARIMAGAGRQPPARAWLRFLAPLPVLRYGLAAAAGAAVMMAAYELHPILPDGANYRELAGTMVPDGSRAGVRVLDRKTTQSREVTGLVELQQSDGRLLLEVRLDAAEPVELAIDFTAAGLQPVGVVQRGLPFESVEIDDRTLRARALGRRQISVSLRRVEDAAVADEAAIRLVYSSNGRVLEQGSLSSAVK